MIFGYARVSTKTQARDGNSLEAQQAALTAAGKDTFPWERLFSHHFPLGQAEEAVKASMPRESMKVVIAPWME